LLLGEVAVKTPLLLLLLLHSFVVVALWPPPSRGHLSAPPPRRSATAQPASSGLLSLVSPHLTTRARARRRRRLPVRPDDGALRAACAPRVTPPPPRARARARERQSSDAATWQRGDGGGGVMCVLCGLVSSSAVADCALCFVSVWMWRRARQAGACCHFPSPMATAIGRSDTDREAIGRETAPTTAIEREIAAIERETTAIERETTAIERETAAIEREMAAIERETAAMERETAAIAREMAATDSDRARFGTGTTRDRRDFALRSTRVEIDQDARSAWSVWSVWSVPPL